MNNVRKIAGIFGVSLLLVMSACESNKPPEKIIERPDMTPVKTDNADAAEEADSQADLTMKVVEIKNMVFNPAELTVRPGDTIVWVNNDIVVHDVTAEDTSWTSGNIAVKASWQYIPKGSFDYICSIHPTMKASVVMEEE